VHIPKEKRKKLDAKAEKCILLGYSDEQKVITTVITLEPNKHA
jgi:hypothetical protein